MGHAGGGPFCVCLMKWVVRELFQRGFEQGEVRPCNSEVGPLAASLAFEQASLANHLHMAGNRRMRHVENVGELTNTERPIHHQTHHPPTSRVGEGTEERNGIRHNDECRYEVSFVKAFILSKPA